MKILHAFSIASVPQVLATAINEVKGFFSIVIARQRAHQDINSLCGFDEFYSDVTQVSHGRAMRWKLKVLWEARKYDIIHVHDTDEMVKKIKRLYPRKKIILTYHGSRIREKWSSREDKWKLADLITVVSPDLLNGAPEGVIHIPNPVDTNHFSQVNPYIPNTALYIYNHPKYGKALNLVKLRSKERDLHLTVLDRRLWTFRYGVFPRFLEIFEYYIDIQQAKDSGQIIPNLMNLVGFQTLALGGKVILSNGRIVTTLPHENSLEYVKDKWISVYRQLLDDDRNGFE